MCISYRGLFVILGAGTGLFMGSSTPPCTSRVCWDSRRNMNTVSTRPPICNTQQNTRYQWVNGSASISNVRGLGFEPCQGQGFSSSYEIWGWWLSRPSDETINWGKVCVYAFRTSSTHYKYSAVSVHKWKHKETIMHSVSCLIPASNTQNWA
jgi:hypothetical protein